MPPWSMMAIVARTPRRAAAPAASPAGPAPMMATSTIVWDAAVAEEKKEAAEDVEVGRGRRILQ
jgi:hypothetical protein